VPWRLKPPDYECYALMENGAWYGVVRCLRGGVSVGEEVVLRDWPVDNAIDALRIARTHADEACAGR
jgi:hypothetical protein